MNSIKFVLSIISVVCLFYTNAQNYESDALKFSLQNFSGSARYTALGGAFSSVGADLSNFSHNPAGVGMYRNSIFQGSFGVNYTKTNSTYNNNSIADLKVNAAFPNLGFVFASKKPSKNGMIRNAAFGLSLSRLADYNSLETINSDLNTPFSSISWSWVDEMNNTYSQNQDPVLGDVSFETFNAYYGYLVNYDTSYNFYTSPVLDSISQTRYLENTGGKNEVAISGGFNYIDKLYVGASLGIPFINYESTTRFIEKDENDLALNTFFNEFEWKRNYETEGIGFNFKLGAIYKPTDWLRVSAAFHTPERINFNETYTSNTFTEMDFATDDYDDLVGEFDYKLRLPWKANTGFSLFYKKLGFISVDYEAIAYNSAKYDFGNDYKETADLINANIKAKHQIGHNIRFGIEGKIKKARLRAGYNYAGSPIKKEYAVNGFDFSRHTLSGGFGFVLDKIAIDFAYQHNVRKQFEQPYTVEQVDISGINKSINQGAAIFSLAYKLN